MKKQIILLWSLSFAFLLKGQHLPDAFIKSPVFIEHEKGQGTGFFVQGEKYTYFITAKHNISEKARVEKDEKIDTVDKIFTKYLKLTTYFDDPSSSEKNVMYIDIIEAIEMKLIKYHEEQDIAVIRLGEIEKMPYGGTATNYYPIVKKDKNSWIYTIHISLFQKFNDVRVGDEVFIFGYPTSLGIVQSPQFDYTRPLLRKGIIAGKYNEKSTIIIDCPSYPGNSGGPVIVRNITRQNIEYYLVGIVIEFIPYEEKWINNRSKIINTERYNSGYSVAVSIDAIKELIERDK